MSDTREEQQKNELGPAYRQEIGVKSAAENDPGVAAVKHFLLYSLSLPERMLRTTSALVGGAIRESTALLLPQAFRSSKTYNVFVQQMLDFMVVDIGGVENLPSHGAPGSAPAKIENFVARKTVSNFVELAGFATLHLSPLTVLALLSDIAYGSQTYLQELSNELKKNGIIDKNSTIDNAAGLLSAVSQASGVTAEAFGAPPLSAEGLKQTIQQTREALAHVDPSQIIPQAEIERLWREMKTMSQREGVGMFEISSAMTLYTLGRVGTVGRGALSSVVVAGNMFDRHILQHYSGALDSIREKGFYKTLSESSRPYISATWQNFSTQKTTITEYLFSGRWIANAWLGLRKLFRRRRKVSADSLPKQGE